MLAFLLFQSNGEIVLVDPSHFDKDHAQHRLGADQGTSGLSRKRLIQLLRGNLVFFDEVLADSSFLDCRPFLPGKGKAERVQVLLLYTRTAAAELLVIRHPVLKRSWTARRSTLC